MLQSNLIKEKHEYQVEQIMKAIECMIRASTGRSIYLFPKKIKSSLKKYLGVEDISSHKIIRVLPKLAKKNGWVKAEEFKKMKYIATK